MSLLSAFRCVCTRQAQSSSKRLSRGLATLLDELPPAESKPSPYGSDRAVTSAESLAHQPGYLANRKRVPVLKKPRKERESENPGLGGRLPRAPPAAAAQPIYFPNFDLKLVRSDDPYTAIFHAPLQLTKPDLATFLQQVYGLEMTGIRTAVYRGEIKRVSENPSRRTRERKRSYKKVWVQLKEPFWYPARPSPQILKDYFDAYVLFHSL